MHHITAKTLTIPPFVVMEILERAEVLAQQGRDIVHLEIGEPDFPTPEPIRQAGIRAIKEGQTRYTHSLGILPLREAIARQLAGTYGVEIDPGRILITSGTSPALFMVCAALLEPGDEVILPDPYYPCYPNFIRFFGGNPVVVPTEEAEGFQLDPERVRKALGPRTRAILINSPSNPTGCLLEADRMAALGQLGPPVISDEIYHGLVYGAQEHSMLEFTPDAFVINGFSKRYAMTGWRLGYLIAPPPYVRPLQKVHQNFFISAGSIAQWAGITALTEASEEVEEMRRTYDERRRYMLDRLRAMGLGPAVEPRGAFYMLANIGRVTHDSAAFANGLLEQEGVGVAPGIEFGRQAEGYLRLSYANSLANIGRGLDRLQTFLDRC